MSMIGMDKDILLAIDCGSSMRGLSVEDTRVLLMPDEEGITSGNPSDALEEPALTSRFNISQAIAIRFLQQLMINTTAHNLVCPLLFGTVVPPVVLRVTEHEPVKWSKTSSYMYELTGLETPNMALLRALRDLEPSDAVSVDCLDAIVSGTLQLQMDKSGDTSPTFLVGMRLLDKYGSAAHKRQREVLVITDGGGGRLSASSRGTPASLLVEQLQDFRCHLCVVWIDSPTPTEAQRETESFLRDLCTFEGHRFIGAFDMLKALSSFVKKCVRPTTKTRLPFILNASVQFPVWCYLNTKEEAVPPPAAQSAAVPPDARGSVLTKRRYVHVDSEERRIEGDKKSLAEDQRSGTECEFRSQAVLYGRDIVPLTEAEIALLKYDGGPKGIIIHGSIPASHIPLQNCMLEKTEWICADPHSPFAQVAVSDLVESLKPTGNALVGRYVWREPHPPKMVLLSPDSEQPILFLNVLPFCEHYQETKSLPGLPPISEQDLAAMNDFVDAMMLYPSANGSAVDAVAPTTACPEELIPNPTLHRFYRFLIQKALPHPFSLPLDNDALETFLDVPDRCRDAMLASIECIERLERAFPLVPTPGRRGARDAPADGEHGDAKRTLTADRDNHNASDDNDSSSRLSLSALTVEDER